MMISGEKWISKTEQEETGKSEKLDNWMGDNKKSADVLLSNEKKPSLQERIFKQLLDFSQAVQSVEEELKNNPEANKDGFAKILDQYNFSSRQKEAFLEGIEELLRRRGNIARALQYFEKEYGEQHAPELFKSLFKSSGTFGEVRLHKDPDNLIFLCENSLDAAQGIHPGHDAYALAKEQRLDLDELRKRMANQLPVAAFLAHPDLEIGGIGSFSKAAIIINMEELRQRENVDLESAVRHERQHARNSLYLRPEMMDNQKISELIEDSASTFKSWIPKLDRIIGPVKNDLKAAKQERGFLSLQEVEKILDKNLTDSQRTVLEEFFHRSLENIRQILRDLIACLKKGTTESVIKEELLAYYLSGTKNEEIGHILPRYLTDLKAKLCQIKSTYEKLLFNYYPDNLLEKIGFVNPWGQRAFSGTFDSLGLVWGDKDDILNKNFNREVEMIFNELEASCRSAIKEGLEIFHRIDETEKSGQAGLKKNLVPILISQPLDKWPRLLELALRSSATRSEFSQQTGE